MSPHSLMGLNKYLTLLIIVVHIYSLFPLGLSDYFPSHFLFMINNPRGRDCYYHPVLLMRKQEEVKKLEELELEPVLKLRQCFPVYKPSRKYLVFSHHMWSYLHRSKVINKKILNFSFLYCLRLTSLLPVEVATHTPSYCNSISPRNGLPRGYPDRTFRESDLKGNPVEMLSLGRIYHLN